MNFDPSHRPRFLKTFQVAVCSGDELAVLLNNPVSNHSLNKSSLHFDNSNLQSVPDRQPGPNGLSDSTATGRNKSLKYFETLKRISHDFLEDLMVEEMKAAFDEDWKTIIKVDFFLAVADIFFL